MSDKVEMNPESKAALMQIINATKDNKIDFLILDEVAGNLSPNRREALTKLINKPENKHNTTLSAYYNRLLDKMNTKLIFK